MIHLFEKTDEKCLFKRARSVNIDVDPSSQVDQAMPNGATSNEIVCLTLSPSEENVVCSTRSQQLYNLTLSAADIERVGIHNYLVWDSMYCLSMTFDCTLSHFVFSLFREQHLTIFHLHSIVLLSLGWMCVSANQSLPHAQ